MRSAGGAFNYLEVASRIGLLTERVTKGQCKRPADKTLARLCRLCRLFDRFVCREPNDREKTTIRAADGTLDTDEIYYRLQRLTKRKKVSAGRVEKKLSRLARLLRLFDKARRNREPEIW